MYEKVNIYLNIAGNTGEAFIFSNPFLAGSLGTAPCAIRDFPKTCLENDEEFDDS